jgi:hypothetical protein
VGGGAAYWFYQRVRSELSPESIQESAESVLADLAGQDVQVGSAELGIADGTLSLSRVRIASQTETFFSADRIVAFADGGLSGLKEGRFAQLRIEKPVLTLERRGGQWNLSAFLTPILHRVKSKGDETSGTSAPTSLPLNRVQLNNPHLTVTLEDGKTYSAVEFARLDLSRENPESPWELSAQQGSLRLNPTADEWPLLDAAELLQALVVDLGVGGASQTPSATGESQSMLGLKRVFLDEVQVDLIQQGQSLSVGGLSFEAQEFFQFLKLQTGSLEKKSLKPSA